MGKNTQKAVNVIDDYGKLRYKTNNNGDEMEYKHMSLDQLAEAGAQHGKLKEYPVNRLAKLIRNAAVCQMSDLLSELIFQEESIDEMEAIIWHHLQNTLMQIHEDNKNN